MSNIGLSAHPIGVQYAYPLGTVDRPVMTFSNRVGGDLTTGIYATITPLSGATGTGIGISVAGTEVFEASNYGVTIVPAGLSVGGVAYTWPSSAPTASSFLTADSSNAFSWTAAATSETINGNTLQYFTDPQVRRLLEEILATLRGEGVE